MAGESGVQCALERVGQGGAQAVLDDLFGDGGQFGVGVLQDLPQHGEPLAGRYAGQDGQDADGLVEDRV
ncbi:hypothetical protein [Streptomyces sp. NPDC048521]|uniref:hypothetical protein n=1 Tax=Streptomyces sp. NPDC048521 TaxID=3365566 RepID=UPI003710D062